jgi:hypothetical protein
MKGQNVGGVDEEVRPEIFALGISGDLAQIGLQLVLAGAPGEIGVGLRVPELRQRPHHLRPSEGLGKKDHVRIDRLHLADHPFPERKRFGVRIVDPEDAHALFHPEQHDVAQGAPKRFVVDSVEVGIDDVFVFLGRIFRVFDRAVGPPGEPFRMLCEPGVIRRALNCEIERDFHAVVGAGLQQPLEIGERSELGMHGIVPALGSADGVWAAGVAGFGHQGIVAALAVDAPDRTDRRQIKNVETERDDLRESGDAIVEGAVPAGDRALASRQAFRTRRPRVRALDRRPADSSHRA